MDADDDRDPPPAQAMTRRQRLADLLSMESRSVESIAAEFRAAPRDVEDDLRSLERTLRRDGKRIAVTAARCRKCGFVFEDRSRRRFATPTKCPQCQASQIEPALLRIR
jgi:predicted Zn-ribbon and HTH transcriptional regulator